MVTAGYAVSFFFDDVVVGSADKSYGSEAADFEVDGCDGTDGASADNEHTFLILVISHWYKSSLQSTVLLELTLHIRSGVYGVDKIGRDALVGVEGQAQLGT
jgi:hypothetical protein